MSNFEFENAYIELEQYLRMITELPEGAGVVALYEKTLPPERVADIKTLRNYRNNVSGHGKKIGGVVPTVPVEWLECLNKELKYVRENQENVAYLVKNVYKKLNNTSFASALERIYNYRKNNQELQDSLDVHSKLNESCSSRKNKQLSMWYYEIDKKLHLFHSILEEKKDLRPYYGEVKDILSEKDFYKIIDIVEGIVSNDIEREESQTQNTSEQNIVDRSKNQSGTTSVVLNKVTSCFGGVDSSACIVMIFVAAAILALMTTMAFVTNWSWDTWQWVIGAAGGVCLGLVAFGIVFWLDDEVVIDYYILGTIVFCVIVLLNFIIYLFLKEKYKIIFACFSVVELVLLLYLLVASCIDLEYGFCVLQVLAIGLTLISVILCSFDLSWTLSQWAIGLVGGISIFLAIIWFEQWIDDECFDLDGCWWRIIAFGVIIVLNFILFAIFKDLYKIIFGCLSLIGVSLGVYHACSDIRVGEGGCAMAQITEIILMLITCIVGLKFI